MNRDLWNAEAHDAARDTRGGFAHVLAGLKQTEELATELGDGALATAARDLLKDLESYADRVDDVAERARALAPRLAELRVRQNQEANAERVRREREERLASILRSQGNT